MSQQYVCYDVKGIQSFIFRVPRLKYVIGGSALIDEFDRKTMVEVKLEGATRLSSAGGKGAFQCASVQVAEQLEKVIVEKAHEIGVDVRIGRASTFLEASHTADRTYSYLPDTFEGHPCQASGLYPVAHSKEGVHPIVQQREAKKGYFEKELLKSLRKIIALSDCKQIEFFHNVDLEDREGRKGAQAIGGRNRWAVICMDGNDMGAQFRAHGQQRADKDVDVEWLKQMSAALDESTRGAACEGMIAVIQEWLKDNPVGQDSVVLPIRPLVIGGDDITLLCHVQYAFTFVKTVCAAFRERSRSAQYKHLWVGTNGELSISAGILFCPVSLPLHTAIPYAEALLASAKGKGRRVKKDDKGPSPETLDWEQVTDGLIDTPAARRQRELRFFDQACGYGLQLTKRPYLLTEFSDLEEKSKEYNKLPATIRSDVLPALVQPLNERLSYYARIKKNHTALYNALQEFEKMGEGKSSWRLEDTNTAEKYYATSVVDAMLLLEETQRMSYETI